MMKMLVDLPLAFSHDLSIGNVMLVKKGFRETGTVIVGLAFQEEIRNQLSPLGAQIVIQDEKFASTVLQMENDAETGWEMDRKLDMQYQRNICRLKSEASERAERERKVAEEAERVTKEAALKMAEKNSARSAATAQAGTIGQRESSAATFSGMHLLSSTSNSPMDIERAGHF